MVTKTPSAIRPEARTSILKTRKSTAPSEPAMSTMQIAMKMAPIRTMRLFRNVPAGQAADSRCPAPVGPERPQGGLAGPDAGRRAGVACGGLDPAADPALPEPAARSD